MPACNARALYFTRVTFVDVILWAPKIPIGIINTNERMKSEGDDDQLMLQCYEVVCFLLFCFSLQKRNVYCAGAVIARVTARNVLYTDATYGIQ